MVYHAKPVVNHLPARRCQDTPTDPAIQTVGTRRIGGVCRGWPLHLCCPSDRISFRKEIRLSESISLDGLTSSLWGKAGESWSPAGRLCDFSYAGYRTGTVPLPTITDRVSVRDFGAIGDGTSDDSGAFQRAIDTVSPGSAVFVPTGRYRISDILYIRKSHVVLQGEDQHRSVLTFDRSLSEITGQPESSGFWFPHTTPPSDGLSWSFSGGLIWAQGEDKVDSHSHLTDVVGEYRRGDRVIRVASSEGLEPGAWVRLAAFDPPPDDPNHGTLLRHLHGGVMEGGAEQCGKQLISFLSRIESIDDDTVTLERYLPDDVRPIWQPQLHRFTPTVEEIGIENLTIQMPGIPYAGHFKEPGFNAISLFMVSNSWVRDITILNADTGVFASFANFCTMKGITISGDESRGPINGHHGIALYFPGTDNLITDFAIEKKQLHDLTIEQFVSGNVFSNGSGIDICMDHHRAAPYQNLFSNIDLGIGSRPFACGGGGDRGSHTARYATFWNIRSDQPLELPEPDFGPSMTFVGMNTSAPPESVGADWHVETIRPDQLVPQDIHESQVSRRRSFEQP